MNDSEKLALERILKEFDSFLENPKGWENEEGVICNSSPFLSPDMVNAIESVLKDNPRCGGDIERYEGCFIGFGSGISVGLVFKKRLHNGLNIEYKFSSFPVTH